MKLEKRVIVVEKAARPFAVDQGYGRDLVTHSAYYKNTPQSRWYGNSVREAMHNLAHKTFTVNKK